MKNLSEREANLRGYLLERLHSLKNMQRNYVCYLPIEKVLNLYDPLHESDITKFIEVSNLYFNNINK